MPLPPGPLGLPVIGDTVSLYRDPYSYGHERFARYGPISKARLLGKPAVMLLSAEGQRFVLVTAQRSFDTGAGYAIVKPLLGNALTLTDGTIHDQLKRWMLPAFASRNLEGYLETINRVILARLATWSEDRPIRLSQEFATITFAAGAALLLGLDFGSETDELLRQWNTLAHGVSTLVHMRGPLTRFGRALIAREWLERRIRSIIERQRYSDQVNIVQLLSDAGMPDDEIVTQVIFLIHASFDTTTDTVSWAFVELLRHPDLLARVREEVRATTTSTSTAYHDAPISLADLQQKPLLDAIIKEALRLYPQVHIFLRGAKEDLEFDGFTIPRGWLVNLNPAFVHRRPDYFADPGAFNPDRFLVDKEDERTPYAWIGFGGGMHGCLGEMIARLEIKALATAVLRRFDLSLLPSQDLHQVYASLSRPKSGVLVASVRRGEEW
jgi:retinoid hydroxylase